MVVRESINRARLALSAGPGTISRLVELGVLVGDLELPRMERWVEYDPAWTRHDIWRRYAARGFRFEDEADVREVTGVRASLRVSDEPFCDGFLEALVAVRGGRALTRTEATVILRGAKDGVLKAAVARYAQLNDGSIAGQAHRPPMELEELLDGSPEEMEGLPGTCLDVNQGTLFEMPAPAWVARVGAMPPGHVRWVATLAILAHPTHGGMDARVPLMLGLLERVSPLAGGRPLSDPATAAAVMGRLAGEGTGDAGVANAKCYAELRELIGAWIEWQKPDPETEFGEFMIALLPAELPLALRRYGWRERDRVTAATLKARALTAGEVARRASARLVCLEARLRQWDRLCAVADAAIMEIRAELDAGREVRFPYRVSDTYRVVRPDGSVAPGLRQTVDLEILPEDMVWLETVRASGWDRSMEQNLSSEVLATSPSRTARRARTSVTVTPRNGPRFEPGGDRRFLVRYAGTSPARAADDEHHAPFLVGLYSVSALVQSVHMTKAQVRERYRVVDELGLERAGTGIGGLTWWRERGSIAHQALRHTGRVYLPYRELRLALAYGCAVGRLELMSGLRIGETMQARHGGCFANVPIGDRVVATMRGRPKGWRRDRLWVIDARTMRLLKRIKGWVIDMFFPDIGVLPIVDYAERRKNDERMQCPPARYLFQVGGRAARNEVLNLCLRIATIGLPHARSHDYRFAFGKLLKIRNATRRQRARALSHEEGSPMVDVYTEWDCEGLDEDDDVVVAHQDALERELLNGILDGC